MIRVHLLFMLSLDSPFFLSIPPHLCFTLAWKTSPEYLFIEGRQCFKEYNPSKCDMVGVCLTVFVFNFQVSFVFTWSSYKRILNFQNKNRSLLLFKKYFA